ncbi:MAG: PilN domain-containing protein [Gemmatimonadaceae bacterium]|nr:PilN domain-containing protein [Gemmatimonadaceae bacterium]
MIEINLLPGARKKSKGGSGGASLNIGALLGSLSERFRDPWLGIAVAGVVLGVAAAGAMWFFQGREEATLEEQQRVAVQDSTRFAAVLAQRSAAEAQRDAILRQIAVISALDGDRFIWPHIMDEIARALPTYTWLRSVTQASSTAPITPELAASGEVPPLSIRVIAYTVDIQAVTIFMRQLEASPFLANVTLGPTDQATTDGKEVRQFQLDMQFEKPDATAIRTVPLSIAVR